MLYDQFKRKAPTRLYHPGKPRPKKAILALYSRPRRASKEVKADTNVNSQDKKEDKSNVAKVDYERPALLEDGQGTKGDGKKTEHKPPSVVKQKQAQSPQENRAQGPKALDKARPQLAGIPHAHAPSGAYHIYRDPRDGFPYQVEISRRDDRGNPRGKRWVLQLFESKSSPKDYRFAPVLFERQGDRHKVARVSEAAGPLHAAMREFENFFASRTGVRWEDRLAKRAVEQPNSQMFTYYPPAPGEPPVQAGPRHTRPAAAESTNLRWQGVSAVLAGGSPGPVSSLKRKASEPVGLGGSKAPKVAHTRRTSAFDSRNSRP